MLVTVLGIVMLVSLEQSSKTRFPMLVTPFGMATLVRLAQPEKALSPMFLTLLGIVTLVMFLLSLNPPILVTELFCMLGGIMTSFFVPMYLIIFTPPLSSQSI